MLARRSLLSILRGSPLAASHGRSFSSIASSIGAMEMSMASQAAKPSLDVANAMPLTTKQLDNNTLVTLSTLGNLSARKEIVRRHIMSVDKVDYEQACVKFNDIEDKNAAFQLFLALPYKIGIGVALTAGFTSFPLVFDINTATLFNDMFVTADVPEPKDLETVLEVGSWTWNWMEPVMGQVSFFLLCLQYSRAQLEKLGVRPYTEHVKARRALRLAKAFPQYDAGVLMGYSKAVPIFNSKKKLW